MSCTTKALRASGLHGRWSNVDARQAPLDLQLTLWQTVDFNQLRVPAMVIMRSSGAPIMANATRTPTAVLSPSSGLHVATRETSGAVDTWHEHLYANPSDDGVLLSVWAHQVIDRVKRAASRLLSPPRASRLVATRPDGNDG